jgi:Ca2+-binding RTX toxin-like protein
MGTGAMRVNQTNLLNFTDADISTVGKSPTLSFTLDSLPTGTGTATVTATVIEGSDGTRSGTEDMITLTVNVAYNDGQISMPAGTATGSFDTGNGTSVSFTLDNPTVHAFTIGTTATDTGTALPTLDVKLGNLYQAFTDGAGSAEVLHTGTYSIAIETTLPLQNTANETVTKFTGSLELTTSTMDSIYGTSGADTITGGDSGEVIIAGAGKDTISTGAGSDYVVLAAGFGSTTLANTNTVSDFTNATDKFALDGLTFAELTVAEDATTSADTNISITATGEYLMTLTGVAYGYILADDFVLEDAIGVSAVSA